MKYLFVLLLAGLMVGCVEDTRPMCDKVDGLQIADESLVPSDYTGVVKECEDGKVQELLNYKDGERDGLRKLWHTNGQLWFESNYKDDKKDGLRKHWRINGQLISERNYKDGERDGLEKWWHENGQLKSEINYKDGDLISEKCWDEDGNEIKCKH